MGLSARDRIDAILRGLVTLVQFEPQDEGCLARFDWMSGSVAELVEAMGAWEWCCEDKTEDEAELIALSEKVWNVYESYSSGTTSTSAYHAYRFVANEFKRICHSFGGKSFPDSDRDAKSLFESYRTHRQ